MRSLNLEIRWRTAHWTNYANGTARCSNVKNKQVEMPRYSPPTKLAPTESFLTLEAWLPEGTLKTTTLR